MTKVTYTDERIGDGIGYREITVEGTVVEVIRGETKDLKFSVSKSLVRIVDHNAADAKFGEATANLITTAQRQSGGIEDCTAGRRYVAIYPSAESGHKDEWFFAEVAKDQQDWRKRILPRRHPQDNELP